MRISGGRARGVVLKVPPGDHVRPATDGLRQGVFSSLAARIPGAVFFDLFAGSGGYGLEALSRGAAGGAFVERNARTAACIRHNLGLVGRSLGRDLSSVPVIEADAAGAPWGGPGLPDLVFIDPPYADIPGLAPRLLERLAVLLAPCADPLVVFEMPGEIEPESPGWRCVKRLGRGARQPSARFYAR